MAALDNIARLESARYFLRSAVDDLVPRTRGAIGTLIHGPAPSATRLPSSSISTAIAKLTETGEAAVRPSSGLRASLAAAEALPVWPPTRVDKAILAPIRDSIDGIDELLRTPLAGAPDVSSLSRRGAAGELRTLLQSRVDELSPDQLDRAAALLHRTGGMDEFGELGARTISSVAADVRGGAADEVATIQRTSELARARANLLYGSDRGAAQARLADLAATPDRLMTRGDLFELHGIAGLTNDVQPVRHHWETGPDFSSAIASVGDDGRLGLNAPRDQVHGYMRMAREQLGVSMRSELAGSPEAKAVADRLLQVRSQLPGAASPEARVALAHRVLAEIEQLPANTTVEHASRERIGALAKGILMGDGRVMVSGPVIYDEVGRGARNATDLIDEISTFLTLKGG